MRNLVWLWVPALAACGRQPAPDATVAAVWSWAFEDQPYLELRGDESLVHRGEVVGRLFLVQRTFTLPPRIGVIAYEEMGPVTTVDDTAFVQFMRPTFGVAPDGSIMGAHIDDDLGSKDTLAPWGRMEPADAPEPVRTGLLWATTATGTFRPRSPWFGRPACTWPRYSATSATTSWSLEGSLPPC